MHTAAYTEKVGAWGAGIFEDDVALDVRDAWKDALAAGSSPSAASARLKADFAEYLRDEDDAPIFWFALAELQLETGSLTTETVERVTEAIPANLERWRDDATPDDYAARQASLEALRQRLSG